MKLVNEKNMYGVGLALGMKPKEVSLASIENKIRTLDLRQLNRLINYMGWNVP
jgi:hypothetical protein